MKAVYAPLQLALLLKEAGFPQWTEFIYISDGDETKIVNRNSYDELQGLPVAAAPLAFEIMDALPPYIFYQNQQLFLYFYKDDAGQYRVMYGRWDMDGSLQNIKKDDSLVVVAGDMWLFLKDRGLL